MVTATVDNTPVTVLLDDNETYTPASGSVQKVTVMVHPSERLDMTKGGTTLRLTGNKDGSGEPNTSTGEMLITDTETLVEAGQRANAGVYISGFEVS